MSRRHDETPRAEELLATHADGGLDPEQRDEVERLLESDPEARAELDAMRETLSQVRAARPRPATEPDWSAMAADIAAACDDVDREREASLPGRLRRFFGPRHALVAAAAAAAAVLLWIAVRDGAPDRERGVASSAPPPAPVPELAVAMEPPRPSLEELGGAELDELATALSVDHAGQLFAPTPEPGGASAEPLLAPDPDELAVPPDVAAEVTGLEAPDEPVEYVTGFDGQLFGEPSYDDWVEELDESELDALDAYIADVLAG